MQPEEWREWELELERRKKDKDKLVKVDDVDRSRDCIDCGNPIEFPEYEDNERCRSCYLKFVDKALRCVECGESITWHIYHWHRRLCSKCEMRFLDDLSL